MAEISLLLILVGLFLLLALPRDLRGWYRERRKNRLERKKGEDHD
jgi:hypothetical protein